MRVLSIALLSLMTGCSLLQPQPIVQPEPIIKTVTKVVPLEIYQPPLPTEITLSEVDFFVITENNLEEQIERLEKLQGGSFVIFAMTPQTYENMAYNLQEIRRYIGQQKEISSIIAKQHKTKMTTRLLKIGSKEIVKRLKYNKVKIEYQVHIVYY